MPDGNTTVIIQGKKRFKVAEVITEEPYINATVREVPQAQPGPDNEEFSAIIESIKELALQIIRDSPKKQFILSEFRVFKHESIS